MPRLGSSRGARSRGGGGQRVRAVFDRHARGASAAPSRRASWGSSLRARAAARERRAPRPRCRRCRSAAKRPGCSDWAERTRPQTAAAPGRGTPPRWWPSRRWVTAPGAASELGLVGEPSLDRARASCSRRAGRLGPVAAAGVGRAAQRARASPQSSASARERTSSTPLQSQQPVGPALRAGCSSRRSRAGAGTSEPTARHAGSRRRRRASGETLASG